MQHCKTNQPRPTHCIFCQYDISALPCEPGSLCPECGGDLSVSFLRNAKASGESPLLVVLHTFAWLTAGFAVVAVGLIIASIPLILRSQRFPGMLAASLSVTCGGLIVIGRGSYKAWRQRSNAAPALRVIVKQLRVMRFIMFPLVISFSLVALGGGLVLGGTGHVQVFLLKMGMLLATGSMILIAHSVRQITTSLRIATIYNWCLLVSSIWTAFVVLALLLVDAPHWTVYRGSAIGVLFALVAIGLAGISLSIYQSSVAILQAYPRLYDDWPYWPR